MAAQGEMWLAVGMGQVAFWIAMSPLIRAWARRLEHRGVAAPELEARLAALEERGPVTGEVDLTRARLAELEERLDFAERLLAKQADAARIGRGEAGG